VPSLTTILARATPPRSFNITFHPSHARPQITQTRGEFTRLEFARGTVSSVSVPSCVCIHVENGGPEQRWHKIKSTRGREPPYELSR